MRRQTALPRRKHCPSSLALISLRCPRRTAHRHHSPDVTSLTTPDEQVRLRGRLGLERRRRDAERSGRVGSEPWTSDAHPLGVAVEGRGRMPSPSVPRKRKGFFLESLPSCRLASTMPRILMPSRRLARRQGCLLATAIPRSHSARLHCHRPSLLGLRRRGWAGPRSKGNRSRARIASSTAHRSP